MDDLEDSAPPPVVALADAFMQRRRPSPSPAESDDLPVLTEVVPPEGGDVPLPAEAGAMPASAEESDAYDPAVLNILAHELARRLQEHLETEIPSLVEAALQAILPEVAQELQGRLAERAESILNDFLAERDHLARIQQQR